MNKIRFYQFLVVGLLIINVVLVAFTFLGKKKPERPKGPRKLVIERLSFSEDQSQKYDALIDAHRTLMHENEGKIKDLKNELYTNLGTEPQDTLLVDSIQLELSNVKLSIEKGHYAHFLGIKNICTAEQLPAFQSLSKEMAMIFAPHRRRPKHNHRP